MSASGLRKSPLPADRRAPDRDPKDDDEGTGESLDQYLNLDQSNGDDDIATELEPDGGMIVTIGQAYEAPQPDDTFFANLAEVIPDHILQNIATDLLRRIEEDQKAREKHDAKYKEGLQRTGLGDDAPGGAQFEGASRVVHPMLTEACVDYESRIMKELWPIAGPVKKKILGTVTKAKDEKAQRKVEFMNYQLTTQIKEARDVAEEMFTQLPLGGIQYVKQWFDHRLKRARWQFVPTDKVILPATAASFYSSHRRTEWETLTAVEYKQRIDQGMYREVALTPPSQAPEKSKAQEANEKIEGVQDTGMNIDADRDIYCVMSYLEVTEEMATVLKCEEQGDLNPYLISIDKTSRQVLSFYRDWEPQDPTKEPIDHLFEFTFIPWRGAMAVGLPHMIGGLSGAATGALRALLDSAHIANTQGYFVLKGSGVSGQNKRPNPGEAVEIESGLEANDIRQKIMPFETKEPSNVLFQLLGFLVEAGKSTVRTSLDEQAIDANTNVPVGTQLSRVEEGLVVFSSIHGRVHTAFNRLLVGLHRLNALYLPELLRVDAEGKEILVRRKDFEGPMDCAPVSDPTIYSDQQRMAQMLAIQQRAAVQPGLYNPRAVEERFLKLLKVPQPDELLAAAREPQELNAVNENVAMALGRPVAAFPDQDHLAHLQAHLDFLQSPVLGSNPLLLPTFMPPAIKHCAEHIVMFYAKVVNDMVSHAAGRPAVDLMSDHPETKQLFDRLLALASQRVVPMTQQAMSNAIPVLMTAFQKVQALMPKPPIDPGQATVAAAQAETARKGANDQATNALKAQQLAENSKNDQVRNAIDAERVQAMRDNAQTSANASITRTAMETQSARDIAEGRIESGQSPKFSDGTSMAG